MKTTSKASQTIKPNAVGGTCTLPNCPICGDPVASDGNRPTSDGNADRITLNQPHEKALGEWMSQLQLLAYMDRAFTMFRWALEGFLCAVLTKVQWTKRVTLEEQGCCLFPGLELWTNGRYKPPVLFSQLLDKRKKPTGKYFLGPQVGEGFVMDLGRKGIELDDQDMNGLLDVAAAMIQKGADAGIAAKIDGALNTDEQLNPFLQFCRQALVCDVKLPVNAVACVDWTTARSFGNNQYRVKEIHSKLKSAAVPLCLLAREEDQAGVLLRCDYDTALAHFTEARQTSGEVDLFRSQWITRVFDPHLNDQLYDELDRVYWEQENRIRSQHKQEAQAKNQPAGRPAGAQLDLQSLTSVVLKTDHIREQVDEVLAQHPAIDTYIRGRNSAGQVTAESVAACYILESASHYCWHGKLTCAASDLKAAKKEVCRAPEASPGHAWVGTVLDVYSSANVGITPQDKQRTLIRLLTLLRLVARLDRSQELYDAKGRYREWTKSDRMLAVKGRPDLTRLKKHLLKQGGKSFQRNDCLALQIDPIAAAKLVAEGTFRAGNNLILEEMEPSNCHGNALTLAGFEGVDVWRGFGLNEDMWAFHSWCVCNGRIIETTGARETYFGIHVPVPFHKLLNAAAIHNPPSNPLIFRGKDLTSIHQ
jgi:hypothetical protein